MVKCVSAVITPPIFENANEVSVGRIRAPHRPLRSWVFDSLTVSLVHLFRREFSRVDEKLVQLSLLRPQRVQILCPDLVALFKDCRLDVVVREPFNTLLISLASSTSQDR